MKGFPCLVLTVYILTTQASEEDENLRSERVRSKSRRFNDRGMPFGGSSGGSGGGSESPFHSGGGMGGMSSGGAMMNVGPFGGGPMGMGSSHSGALSGPMRGPKAPGNPALGGPSSTGHGMFNAEGSNCIRHRIMCPEWCRIVDENGCHSCPCGPGNLCL
ncbi:loricrin-like [Pecten maximus]|uniref:loricrin-like n=1 Tax=Pecten maximus TaxID=6579 RepID=UPI001458F0F2|nr:loricrin-like [Pecten maximus]